MYLGDLMEKSLANFCNPFLSITRVSDDRQGAVMEETGFSKAANQICHPAQ